MRTLTFFFIFHCFNCLGQDLHFSQFQNVPLATNPALTGVMSGNYRLVANARRHWSSVAGSKTWEHSHFSFDARRCVGNNFFAVGLLAQGDRAGLPALSNLTGALTLAFHHELNRWLYLSAGASAGVLHYRLDASGMTFDEQFDASGHNPTLPNFEDFETNNRTVPDISTGLLLFSPQAKGNARLAGWTLGAALHHVNQPAYSFLDEDANRLGMGISLHGSATFILSKSGEKMKLTARNLYRRQSVFENSKQWLLLPGATWRYGLGKTEFGAGISCRMSGHSQGKPATLDALVPAVFFDFETLSLGFSYDVNVSSAVRESYLRGGWEVSVSWQIQARTDCVVCPK